MTSKANALPTLVAALLALGLSSGWAAASVSLVNRDDKEHKLTIIEDKGAKSTDHILKPLQVLEGICANGCIIRINDNEEDEYELESGDKVSIEEGYLYYDEPENAQQGAAATPAAPGGAPAGAAPGPAPAEAPKR